MSNILPRSIAPALNSALLAPPMLSVLRIAAGLAFLEHGTGKLLGFPARLPFIDKMPTGLLYFTGTMELVGGALIVLGLFTRPTAFILSGFMAAAYISWRTSR
jgi:putative oxidoreductase